MACPYFFPTERVETELWPHRRRLPLGDGWRGHCTAGDCSPTDDQLKQFCNMGYAKGCSYLPPDRKIDAVRFGLREAGGRIGVYYICERAHAPGESGTLELDPATRAWVVPHPDRCIQRMAECFLASCRAPAASSK